MPTTVDETPTMKHVAIMTFAVIVAAVLYTPGVASAQSDARAKAYQLYQQGVEAYKEGDYERAATYMEDAVEIHRNPVVFYNLSLAYSKLGRAEDALGAAETASNMDGDMPAETALKNRARIRAYRATLTGAAVAEDVASSGPPDVDTDLSLVGWSGAATAGVGAVLLGTALVMNGAIGNKIDNYEAALDDGELNSARRLYDEIQRQQTTASITVLSGTALLVAGTGVLVYDLFFYEETQQARLGGAISPNAAMLQLSVDF